MKERDVVNQCKTSAVRMLSCHALPLQTMQKRVLSNPKIEILWQHEVVQAFGNDKGALGGIKVVNNATKAVRDVQVSKQNMQRKHTGGAAGFEQTHSRITCLSHMPVVVQVNGLFFAIGHVPATQFLEGQLELDSYGFIKTQPGSTCTSVPGG